ncbi:MAG TPA: hypothetical protein VFM60_05195 [Salinimicrobium sp.]|nr:hypothetical protein [Salinimicrobium sp.]
MKPEHERYIYNYLLRFKPIKFLENMGFQERLSLLQKIFSKAPSDENWNCIYEFFDSLGNNSKERVYFELAEKELALWDDRLKVVYSNSKYVLSDEVESLFVNLIKGVIIYKRETKGNDHLYRISKNKNLDHLTVLRIIDSDLMESGLNALITSENFQNLEMLSLESLVLPQDMKEILFAGSFPKLTDLTLLKIGLSDENSNLIIGSPLIKNLTSLNLSFNLLSEDFLMKLISNTQFQYLRRLVLKGNFMGDKVTEVISERNKINSLQYLDISGNMLGNTSRETLKQRMFSKNLEIIV